MGWAARRLGLRKRVSRRAPRPPFLWLCQQTAGRDPLGASAPHCAILDSMHRRLGDGGSTGVTFNLREYTTPNCTGAPSNADATFVYNNYPVRRRSPTDLLSSCVRLTAGGSLDEYHCDMATLTYKGTRFQSEDCSGSHSTFEYSGDGSCVTANGGSLRAVCARLQAETEQRFPAALIFGSGIAVVCLASCAICLLVCLKASQTSPTTVRASPAGVTLPRSAAITPAAITPAAITPWPPPPLPAMTSLHDEPRRVRTGA